MSSVTSSYAQKSGRSKFLVAFDSADSVDTAFTFDEPVTIPQSVIAFSVFDALDRDTEEISVGDLFLDLGRQIVVYDDATELKSPHREVYRECLRVNGPTTEGIPETANTRDTRVWVRVFSSNGGGVVVARTG